MSLDVENRVESATSGTAGLAARAPLIAHAVYWLKTGGVENGLVNLGRHAIERIAEDSFLVQDDERVRISADAR